MQDVQGLSLSYALKIARPKIFFIDLVRPRVELNHDSCIFLSFFGGGGGGDYAIGDIRPQHHHIFIRYFT